MFKAICSFIEDEKYVLKTLLAFKKFTKEQDDYGIDTFPFCVSDLRQA